MTKQRSNKGRITRQDQAWGAAIREAIERGRIQDPDEAHAHWLAVNNATELPSEAAESTGTEVAEYEHPAEASEAAPLPGVLIPIKFLSAALIAAGSKDIRYYLNGVYVHAVDGELRICATDGHRMIVSRLELPKGEAVPAWGEAGVIIPRDELTQAMPVLTKNGNATGSGGYHARFDHSEPQVRLEVSPDNLILTLTAVNGFASFKMRAIEGKFPEYARVLEANAATLARGDLEAMQAAAINTVYMRGAADIATKIGAKAIRAFVGGENQGVFFTFDGAPDSVLIVMPMRAGEAVSDGVVKMLGKGGINASVAALRAHVTRTTKLLESAKGSKEISEIKSKQSSLNERILKLLAITSNAPKQLTQHA